MNGPIDDLFDEDDDLLRVDERVASSFGSGAWSGRRAGQLQHQRTSFDMPRASELPDEPPTQLVIEARLAQLKPALGRIENDLARGQVCMLLAEQLTARARLLERKDNFRAAFLRGEASALIGEAFALVRLQLSVKTISIDDVIEETASETDEPLKKRKKDR